MGSHHTKGVKNGTSSSLADAHIKRVVLHILLQGMLDHPITVVLNVFLHWKATGLKVSKVMGIQNQEEHIGHVKQLKSDRYQNRIFFLSSIAYVHPYFPKK